MKPKAFLTVFALICLLFISLTGCQRAGVPVGTSSQAPVSSTAVSEIPADVVEDLKQIDYTASQLKAMSAGDVMKLWYEKVNTPPEGIQWAFQLKTPYYAINIPKIICNQYSSVVFYINQEIYNRFYTTTQQQLQNSAEGNESENLIIKTKVIQDERYLSIYIYEFFYPNANTEGYLYSVCYDKKEDRRVELSDALKEAGLLYEDLRHEMIQCYLNKNTTVKENDIKLFDFTGFIKLDGHPCFLCYMILHPENEDGFNTFLCYDTVSKEFRPVINNVDFSIE